MLSKFPVTLTAGDRVAVEMALGVDAADGYTVETVLASGSEKNTLAGTFAGGLWGFDLDASGWTPGTWVYQITATKTGERRTLERGRIQIVADLAGTLLTETRSQVERDLEAVEARLRGDVSQGVAGYTIADRTLDRYSIPDLLALRNSLREDLRRERERERLAKGQASRNRVRTRRSSRY